MAVAALSMALVLSGPGASGADHGQSGQKGRQDHEDQAASLQLPIVGIIPGGATFAGTLDLQKFVVSNGAVMAVGIVRGTISSAGAPVASVLTGPIMLPVAVQPGSPITGAAAPAQATNCSVLHLDFGQVNLNVLGLAVTTQPISIDLSGQTSAGLGQLLCSILETVGNVAGLVDLLNQLLGFLTSTLGALIP